MTNNRFTTSRLCRSLETREPKVTAYKSLTLYRLSERGTRDGGSEVTTTSNQADDMLTQLAMDGKADMTMNDHQESNPVGIKEDEGRAYAIAMVGRPELAESFSGVPAMWLKDLTAAYQQIILDAPDQFFAGDKAELTMSAPHELGHDEKCKPSCLIVWLKSGALTNAMNQSRVPLKIRP